MNEIFIFNISKELKDNKLLHNSKTITQSTQQQ